MPDIIALDRLKSQLLTSGLQERNQALYQVINQLIDFLRQSINLTSAQITALTPSGGGSGGGTIITNANGIPLDGFDGTDGEMGPPGQQGPRGFQGPIGPPGFDGESYESDSLPFVGNSLYDGVATLGTFQQMM